MKNPKKKVIYCMDCPMIATRGIKEMGIGLCERHAKELLTSAMLVKISTHKNKKLT